VKELETARSALVTSAASGKPDRDDRIREFMSDAELESTTRFNELRRSEERFRLLVERVQDYAIFMLDPDGRIASWNIGAERIKGYPASEAIGQHFSIFYPPEDVAAGKPQMLLRKALEQGRVEDEGWRVRRDGSRFWGDVVITALFDDFGALHGFAKVTRDLSDRRRVAELEEADRQKNEFLAVLAHELRNPLTPIRNALYLIGRPDSDGPTIRGAHAIAERQLRHMARLLDDLLDVSRMSQGRIELRRERVDLAVAARHSIETVRGLAEVRHQSVELDASDAPTIVDADPTRVDQVLMNLLSNAIKYTGEHGHIRVIVAREGDEAVLRVRDDGNGIAPEALPKIFDLFVQAEPQRAGGEGVGIGLTLVRRVVELHGGSVTASSAGLGQGSEFVVRLPGGDPSPPAIPQVGEARVAGAGDALRVVVVDDNADLADSLALMLRFMGHDVRSFHDAHEALGAVQKFSPDLVILDVGMPGMDGHSLARRIRATAAGHKAFVVALTGWGSPDDRLQSRAAGIDEHLVKPVEPAAVERMIELARGRRAP
jgi:PAS domain S-box-containing protein